MVTRPMTKKRSLTEDKNKETIELKPEVRRGEPKASSKKVSYGKKDIRSFLALPPFSCSVKKGVALLKQWIKNDVVHLPDVIPPIKIKKVRSIVHII